MAATDQDAKDPIGAPLRAVLNLFDGPLEGVRLPDVDRERLQVLAEAVAEQAARADEARRILREADEALDAARRGLLAAGEKGLRYGRIFAESDEDLLATIDAVKLPGATKPVAKRKRKRSERKGDNEKPDDG